MRRVTTPSNHRTFQRAFAVFFTCSSTSHFPDPRDRLCPLSLTIEQVTHRPDILRIQQAELHLPPDFVNARGDVENGITSCTVPYLGSINLPWMLDTAFRARV